MKIFVCIKQVPDTETKIKILPDQSGIDTAGIKWVMNPYDEFAVEEAIKLRDKNPGSQVWVITAGPKSRAGDVLRTALAMGADEGVLVNTPDFVDSFVTAKILADAIKAEGPAHIIFSGKLSIDDNQSAVPQMIAEFLSIPHVTVVSKFEPSTESVIVERDADGGSKEIFQIMAPVVVAANKGLNMPRYASLPGIMKAKKKVLKEIEASSMTSKVKFSNYTLPQEKNAVKIISGDSKTQVTTLIQMLRDEAKVL